MVTLYIIGNGFDLHHGLKTKPEHFIEQLKKGSVYNEVMNAFEDIGSDPMNNIQRRMIR